MRERLYGFCLQPVERQTMQMRLIIFLEIRWEMWFDYGAASYNIENPALQAEAGV